MEHLETMAMAFSHFCKMHNLDPERYKIIVSGDKEGAWQFTSAIQAASRPYDFASSQSSKTTVAGVQLQVEYPSYPDTRTIVFG